MTVLNIFNLSKSYGDKNVLENISLQVQEGGKIGLVGPNGAGKTTLLRILTGEEDADGGSFSFAKEISAGYLKQRPDLIKGSVLYDQLKRSLQHIYSMGEQLRDLEEKMASQEIQNKPDALENIMEKYGKLSQVFQEKGGYFLEKRIRQVAAGLGFSKEDLNRLVEDFSGGEKTCMQLACLLLEDHDLLLLDEPTNYLDTEAVEWLEEFLKSWRGTLLVVSHDRFFLDQVVNGVAHMENHNLTVYQGNYSDFIKQYNMQKLSLEKAYQKQQEFKKKEEEFIRTSGAGEREKRQAKSREKRLEKLESIEKPQKEKELSLDFNYIGRAGQEVVVFEEVSKYFGETVLFRDASFRIMWGDKVALVGPNGAGKTTLLKIITGQSAASRGIVKLGPGVKTAYFDQEQGQLDLTKTVLEEIMDSFSLTLTEARNFLGRYLFQGEEVFKKIENLSGGERSRLVLAKVALSKGNYLILDEPTNHLDIKGITELESALSNYPGTLLFVSHDRYFISKISSKILEVNNGGVKLYQGDYHYYREIKEREREKEKSLSDKSKSRKELREKEKAQREEMLARRRERRNVENRIKEVEVRIASMEDEISSLEIKLSDPNIYEDFEEARCLNENYKRVKSDLEKVYEEWEKLNLYFDKIK